MGSWDCYCAICGGPFGGSQISRKPRTSRFLRRRAQEAIERQERGLADDESVFDASDESDGGGEDDDGESLDSGDEEWTYDCEVITEDDVRWTEIAHVIGSAHRVKGVSKYAGNHFLYSLAPQSTPWISLPECSRDLVGSLDDPPHILRWT